MNKNIIAFLNGYICPNNPQDFKLTDKSVAATMFLCSELMQFGYILDHEAILNLSTGEFDDIVQIHSDLIDYLKKSTGGAHNHKPFYTGFPQQVMEISESQLWLHQIKHYLSFGTWVANEWSGTKKSAFEHTEYKKIKVDYDLNKCVYSQFPKLLSLNNSLTPTDSEVIEWFLSEKEINNVTFPETIPFKENMCKVFSLLIKNKLLNKVKLPTLTVTDVLRISVGLSGGDVSLPAITKNNKNSEKFKKFTNSEKIAILSLLETTSCNKAEMVLNEGKWKRLGEILHPTSKCYAKRFPKVQEAYNAIRNGELPTPVKGCGLQ